MYIDKRWLSGTSVNDMVVRVNCLNVGILGSNLSGETFFFWFSKFFFIIFTQNEFSYRLVKPDRLFFLKIYLKRVNLQVS